MRKFIGLAVVTVILGAGLWSQDQAAKPAAQPLPVDMKKVLTEIAGDYDFESEGAQVLTVNFFEKDGKLFGAPPGESPEEILPVQGNPLKFDVTVSTTGQYYELEFFRNDKNVIHICMMRTQGVEVLGKKRGTKIA